MAIKPSKNALAISGGGTALLPAIGIAVFTLSLNVHKLAVFFTTCCVAKKNKSGRLAIVNLIFIIGDSIHSPLCRWIDTSEATESEGRQPECALGSERR